MNVIFRELTKTNAASSTKPFILLEWQTLLAIECRTHPYLHHYLGQIPAKQGATGQSRVGNAARSCHPLALSPQGGNTRNIQEHLLHPSCQLYQWCLTLLNWSKLCSVEVTITGMAGPSTRISCMPGFDPCWLGDSKPGVDTSKPCWSGLGNHSWLLVCGRYEAIFLSF